MSPADLVRTAPLATSVLSKQPAGAQADPSAPGEGGLSSAPAAAWFWRTDPIPAPLLVESAVAHASAEDAHRGDRLRCESCPHGRDSPTGRYVVDRGPCPDHRARPHHAQGRHGPQHPYLGHTNPLGHPLTDMRAQPSWALHKKTAGPSPEKVPWRLCFLTT